MTATTHTQDTARVHDLLEQLVQIGAPTGQEQRRAAFVQAWLQAEGLTDVWQDDVGNVLARLGPRDRPALLLDAHLDTVFPDEQLQLRKTPDGRWHCPGVFDNTATCALLMVYARRLAATPTPLPPLLLSFTVGEEGEGNLKGIRQVIDDHGHQLAAALALDLSAGTYTRRCVGSTRLRVRFEAQGGHSWNNFGAPSALHAACRWVAQLEPLMNWTPGELSYNVGRLTGGSSVNAIAADAELLLDLRSTDPDQLAEAERRVRAALAAIDDVTVVSTDIGRRPAATLPAEHPLVQAAVHACQSVGLSPVERAQSTNANWPAHKGIPSICVGLARGGGVHTRGEFLESDSLGPGLTLLAALVAAISPKSKVQSPKSNPAHE